MLSGHDLLIYWNEESGCPVARHIVERALRAAFEPYAGIRAQVDVSVISDGEMRTINRENRNIDAVTDVLSFPSMRLKKPVPPDQLARRSIDPETGRVWLGDILICAQRAMEQAESYGHSVERETAFLAVHGLLHLLGHDHMESVSDAAMQAAQEAALKAAGLERISIDDVGELIERAREARANAWAPYSHYAVGACLLADDGRMFDGVNIENASYGITLCAERCALAAAVAQGARLFTAIAISAKTPPVPCGACRQALYEFSPGMRVLVCGDEDPVKEYRLSELLPEAFGPEALS